MAKVFQGVATPPGRGCCLHYGCVLAGNGAARSEHWIEGESLDDGGVCQASVYY